MDPPSLRLHAFLPSSRANGPGLRAVAWVQGCPLRCPGCCNPGTHDPGGGQMVGVKDLAKTVADLAPEIEGLTLSGGEPLAQLAEVTALVKEVHRLAPELSVLLFTGYGWEEVQEMAVGELLNEVDVVIAGRYDETRPASRGLVTSENQTVHFLTGRYCEADVDAVPVAEVLIDEEGRVVVTGVEVAALRR
jgi:anaerobic ribonucleoside-triphosphate reductase activating protein